jgi:membrane protease YdiL (CAAX protease family)
VLIGCGWLIDQLSAPTMQQPSAGLSSLPLGMRAAMVVTSGFAEELLFVGYSISRLLEITRSRWIAGLIPSVIFVLLHIPGRSPPEVLNAAIAAALFTGLFLWRRNLWTNIIAHTVVDLTPMLIVPAVIQALQ